MMLPLKGGKNDETNASRLSSSSRRRGDGMMQEYSAVHNGDLENDGDFKIQSNDDSNHDDDDDDNRDAKRGGGSRNNMRLRSIGNKSNDSMANASRIMTKSTTKDFLTTRLLIFVVLLLCGVIVLLLLQMNVINEEYISNLWSKLAKIISHGNASSIDNEFDHVIYDNNDDEYNTDDSIDDKITTVVSSRTIHYHTSNLATLSWNPYDINIEEEYTNTFILPSFPNFDATNDITSNDNDDHNSNSFGYIRQPDIVNDMIVFVSEGDLYWARLSNNGTRTTIPAIKLATSIGNILSPKINPIYPYLIAYRATYESRSDIYLLDLRNRKQQKPTQRLTYFDNSVNRIVSWKADGTTLLFAAESNAVSLRDERVYEIILLLKQNDNVNNNNNNNPIHVLEIRPVPLSQAVEGFWTLDEECFYFVRYRQHSYTLRYVGGTAESLWAYCMGESVSVHITHDYDGTSTHPQMVTLGADNQKYLVFMSDRTSNDSSNSTTGSNTWLIGSMNLWVMPLPSRQQLYGTSNNTDVSILYKSNTSRYTQITSISCQFNGKVLQEYAVDPVKKTILLRIGADLYQLSEDDYAHTLSSLKGSASGLKVPQFLPIQVLSDFREQQERLIEPDTNDHLTACDIFRTSYGTTTTLLTLRGQVWVVPVIEDYENYAENNFDGSGQNIPPRRYRVVPGAMTGGSIRVLKALMVPLWTTAADDDDDDFFHTDGSKKNDTSTLLQSDNDNNETATYDEKITTSTPHDIGRRIALILATDPNSATAEQAFYLIEVQSDSINSFTNLNKLPKPFLGGNVSGGSTKIGGLGTILPETLQVSPCGRRFVWADTDNRICVMTIPIYTDTSFMNRTFNGSSIMQDENDEMIDDNDITKFEYQCLPATNEMNEPMSGTMSNILWSPGGRYLAIEHQALNQFHVITIVDCGNPTQDDQGNVGDIVLGRMVQVTPSRFNCYGMYWGVSPYDIFLRDTLALDDENSATTLYFLTDRDVISDVANPWGSRSPTPHFVKLSSHVYALPLASLSIDTPSGNMMDKNLEFEVLTGRFTGDGALEVYAERLKKYKDSLKVSKESDGDHDEERRRRLKNIPLLVSQAKKRRKLSRYETNVLIRHLMSSSSDSAKKSPFPKDPDIDFSAIDDDANLSKKAYRITHIYKAKYEKILAQSPSDGSLVIMEAVEGSQTLKTLRYFALEYPSDAVTPSTIDEIVLYGLSTDRKYMYFTSESGKIRIAANTPTGISNLVGDNDWTQYRAPVSMALSVWPQLEYIQMYDDAWRLLRDYFYDDNMHGVDWDEVHGRYRPLVKRCAKREELDDVFGQMIAELSALHAFVYGGEVSVPDPPGAGPGFVGARLRRVPEWKGYMVEEIPEPDPDFNLQDGDAYYSPLSDQTLRLSGQRGLMIGDVIVGINGESVLQGGDINMHLRGLSGYAARLEVLRLSSGNQDTENNLTSYKATPEPLIVVPIGPTKIGDLLYNAWEWKTRQLAKKLASSAGFTVGYAHLQAMNRDGEDAFARGFFADYDKDAFILDVRHNGGGNIDSWIENAFVRKAWSYWGGRGVQKRNGDIDWDEQYAFRGKLVVLLDEKTASNGEGVSRGISELGLGILIGTRSWGGGIWGSSANKLVDGGIAAAPQWGVFSNKWGWGEGVEMTGVTPDIVVDNDPYQSFHGRDSQLERAIQELKQMLAKDPIPPFSPPPNRPNMSLQVDVCHKS